MSAGSAVALAARAVLAAVLVWSAAAKLRDRRAVEPQLAALVGTGAGTSRMLAVALPVVELAVAAGLVLALESVVPGLAAAALLVVFSAVLLRARPRHVPCPCFGAATSEAPVGTRAVVRNGLLLALAVLATAPV